MESDPSPARALRVESGTAAPMELQDVPFLVLSLRVPGKMQTPADAPETGLPLKRPS